MALAAVSSLGSAAAALRARRQLIVGAEVSFMAMMAMSYLGINRGVTWVLYLAPFAVGGWVGLRWLDRNVQSRTEEKGVRDGDDQVLNCRLAHARGFAHLLITT